MGLSLMALYSKFHSSREETFFWFWVRGEGGGLAWGGGVSQITPSAPPPQCEGGKGRALDPAFALPPAPPATPQLGTRMRPRGTALRHSARPQQEACAPPARRLAAGRRVLLNNSASPGGGGGGWTPRTRKRHQQEHRPQRPTERSDPTQHAKGRTGDRPGPCTGTTTRRNVTRGV